jgi:hypothetical protein
VAEVFTTTTNTATTTTTTTTTTQQSLSQQIYFVKVFHPRNHTTIPVPVCNYDGLCRSIQHLFAIQSFSLYSFHQINNDESLNNYLMYGGEDTVYVSTDATEYQSNMQNQQNLYRDPNNQNGRGGNPPSTDPSLPLSPPNTPSPSQHPPSNGQNYGQYSRRIDHAMIRAIDTIFHAFHPSLVSLQEGESGSETEGIESDDTKTGNVNEWLRDV